MICKNINCNHNLYNFGEGKKKCTLTEPISINESGMCAKFVLGPWGYINSVFNSLDGANCIATEFMNYDVRVGIYGVSNIYNDIVKKELIVDGLEAVSFEDKSTGKVLMKDDLLKYNADIDKFNLFWYELENGDIEKRFAEEDKLKEEYVPKNPDVCGEYGWLSPTGEFIQSDWGHHYTSAGEIIEEKGWKDEFENSDRHGTLHYNDFLVENKGYVLIHSPGLEGYKVTRNESRSLTKAQKEFLFNYFSDIHMNLMAKQFLED